MACRLLARLLAMNGDAVVSLASVVRAAGRTLMTAPIFANVVTVFGHSDITVLAACRAAHEGYLTFLLFSLRNGWTDCRRRARNDSFVRLEIFTERREEAAALTTTVITVSVHFFFDHAARRVGVAALRAGEKFLRSQCNLQGMVGSNAEGKPEIVREGYIARAL